MVGSGVAVRVAVGVGRGVRVYVGGTAVLVAVDVAVGGSVLVEVGDTTGSTLAGAHALRMNAIIRNEINLSWVCLCMSLTASQDTPPA